MLYAYKAWEGDFVPLCTHVQRDLRIPFGIDRIRSILEAEGLRTPRRRRGRTPDATPATVVNLELMVDAASAAAVGAPLPHPMLPLFPDTT